MKTRGSDVERHVHRVPAVQVEASGSVFCEELRVRLTVDGRGVHLLKGAVVFLLKHAVIAEPFPISVTVLLELSLGTHRIQSGPTHLLVQVVDRANDVLEIR